MALYTSILTGGISNHPTTSEEANFYTTDFVNSGVVGAFTATNSVAPMTGAFAANAQGTPDMTIAITAGAAYLSATPAGQNSQKLRVRLTANQNVTIAANASGSTKYDWVYIKIDPTLANAPTLAGDTVATLVTSRSSSSTTDDGTPPTYGLNIAVVTVANGASSITNATIRDKRIQASTTSVDTSITTGWVSVALPAITAVAANGNRSYTLTHASSVAGFISPGMRRRFTRTVAANTYMGGAFNGSSHYFTKTSPSGTLGTVTNNFTIEAVVQPTSYQDGTICARGDAPLNNSLSLIMMASGVIRAIITNAGAANFRYVDTYQSIPLNKKTHVAASWASGTVVIYFDGVSVSAGAALASGTNPTTAGTGGDWSIGRRGAGGQYFSGYISNVAVFDAVLSAATIKQHATCKLTGSETNCIGAWSLDNTANDQSSAANNLTATGGVGYTNISPFGNNGVSSTLEYGLTMSVSADGLTEVVQCPEGCALPTTGGISASAYAVNGNPYGWVDDKTRWGIDTQLNTNIYQAAVTSTTVYNPGSITINFPIGSFIYKAKVHSNLTGSTDAAKNIRHGLSTSSSALSTGYEANTVLFYYGITDTIQLTLICPELPFKHSAATSYYYVSRGEGGGTLTNMGFNATVPSIITLIPSGL